MVIQYAVSVTILLLKLMVIPLVGIISHAHVAEMSCICLNQGQGTLPVFLFRELIVTMCCIWRLFVLLYGII